jgi:NitT/TauT family transport system ATP-binding protein
VDKRRHDPHAPQRYGSTAVYDFPLDDKLKTAIPKEIAALGAPE